MQQAERYEKHFCLLVFRGLVVVLMMVVQEIAELFSLVKDLFGL